MQNRGRNHINLFLAVLSISCCFFISACENDPKMIDDWSKKKEMVEVGKNIEAYLSQESKVKAKLTAPLMLRHEADTLYTEFPNSLHVDFYDDSTKIESWVDSKHGKYFENMNKVYLWDSVVVINIKGDTLKSPIFGGTRIPNYSIQTSMLNTSGKTNRSIRAKALRPHRISKE